MRILIVEDEELLGRLLKKHLEAECYAVDVERDGGRAVYRARTNDYDAVILDDILPNKRGWEICRELRIGGKTMPILCMSVQSELEKKVGILNDGADDYLPKPFSFEEMSARLRALLRRPRALVESKVQLENLVLDPITQTASRDGNPLYLTPKEFALLYYLMRNQGKIVSRTMLFEHVWDSAGDPFSNTIEVHIRNLRKKIDAGTTKKLIHTIPGRGYRISLEKF